MSDRAAILAACLDETGDDMPRLALADWLDENGEPAFGRFLRAGVTASHFRDHPGPIDDPAFYRALAEITDVARAGHPAGWLSALGVGPAPLGAGDWVWDSTGDRVTVRVGPAGGVFARGMLAELTVTLREWYAAARAALRAWPVERVAVRDVPGLVFRVEPPAPDRDGWRLVAALTGRPPASVLMGAVRALVGTEATVRIAPRTVEAEQVFPVRKALAFGVEQAARQLVAELRDRSGLEWPAPTAGG